jgi:hypothetical protein
MAPTLIELGEWFSAQYTSIIVNWFSNFTTTLFLGAGAYFAYRRFGFSSRTSGIWEGRLTPDLENEPCADTWIAVRLVVVTRAGGVASGFIQSSRHERDENGESVVVEAVDDIDELKTKFPIFTSTEEVHIRLLPKYAFRKIEPTRWAYALGRKKTILKCKLVNPSTEKTTLTVDTNIELRPNFEVSFKGHLVKTN